MIKIIKNTKKYKILQIKIRGNFTITAKKLSLAIPKIPHIFLGENLIIRKVDVGSVFGIAQRTSYEYMKLLNEKTNGNFKTLVVDDKDGLHSLPFANHGSKVVMYEPNEVYINGGIIDDINITPITNRKYFLKKVFFCVIL